MDKITLTTIKIRKTTLKGLRLIRAYADEPMVDILDRLVEAELKRYQDIEQESKDNLPTVRD